MTNINTSIKALLAASLFIAATLSNAFGQNNTCKNIYVASFVNPDYTRDVRTVSLTDYAQDALLLKQNGCSVFQRIYLARLSAQVTNEDTVQARKNFRDSVKKSAADAKAERVLFGTLYPLPSNQFRLRLSIESLAGDAVLASGSFIILADDMDSGVRQRNKMTEYVDNLLGTDKPVLSFKRVGLGQGQCKEGDSIDFDDLHIAFNNVNDTTEVQSTDICHMDKKKNCDIVLASNMHLKAGVTYLINLDEQTYYQVCVDSVWYHEHSKKANIKAHVNAFHAEAIVAGAGGK